MRTDAREVLFRGADGGMVDGHLEPIRFERRLWLDDTQLAGALLAYVMNGEPLPVHHGYPLRLVVPNWYSVASVKWLTEIELVSRPFTAYRLRGSFGREIEAAPSATVSIGSKNFTRRGARRRCRRSRDANRC